jgi:ABC-type amino acid transport substrate-binding protein
LASWHLTKSWLSRIPAGSDLVEPVNAALESMKADGKLEEINLKWGLSFEQ